MPKFRAVTTFVTDDGSNLPVDAVKAFQARYESISSEGGDILSTDSLTGAHAFDAPDLDAAQAIADEHALAVIESAKTPIKASIQLEAVDR